LGSPLLRLKPAGQRQSQEDRKATMRVERLSKFYLLRYERGSVLLFGRNAYAIQEALLICRGYRGAPAVEYNFISP
jgi:hypothetical protein